MQIAHHCSKITNNPEWTWIRFKPCAFLPASSNWAASAGRPSACSCRAPRQQALKRLEQRLGVRLLIRTTRQVQVTSEGSLYYQRCVQLLGALEEADTLFSHLSCSHPARCVSTCPIRSRQIVIPALGDFYRRYPDITLALGANDTHVDLLREGVDCVLRAWETEDDSLVARRIAQLPQITCASPLPAGQRHAARHR
ncbi:uncharacterized HTH-type transcriptional regulator YhjC-like [Nilaparvata lugens]|uniref:uncharacterized HTH-type transcriptional regulator YhjC-like n=1 Tax=Nilaparvata lugens TaxID=108931 RepID=UPI00193CDA54|nr:uncharacterized HTH-type transcriptional regulator YhjC-like [Nilaparvata lugens]